MQQYSFTIASETKGDTMRHVRDITEHVFTRVQRDRERGLTTHNLALTTGVDQMDAKMKGLFENEYTVLTGETGGGKTAFALQCTRKNALVGIPVLWFSKEMKGEQLTSRLFSGMSDVLTASQIRDPRGLTMFDLDEVRDTAKKINSLPIYIDDDPNLTLQQLIARGRMAVRRHAVQLIIVDFLQLVDMPGIRDATERLTEVTHGLRDLAKFEKGLHVIGLSQLTRARGFGGKQTMKDRLKGSSAIEQSCQNLIAIEMDEEENGVTDVTLNCEKQREGPKFKVKCVYDRDHLQLLPKEDRYRDVG
jgi:replicative DNA helicase